MEQLETFVNQWAWSHAIIQCQFTDQAGKELAIAFEFKVRSRPNERSLAFSKRLVVLVFSKRKGTIKAGSIYCEGCFHWCPPIFLSGGWLAQWWNHTKVFMGIERRRAWSNFHFLFITMLLRGPATKLCQTLSSSQGTTILNENKDAWACVGSDVHGKDVILDECLRSIFMFKLQLGVFCFVWVWVGSGSGTFWGQCCQKVWKKWWPLERHRFIDALKSWTKVFGKASHDRSCAWNTYTGRHAHMHTHRRVLTGGTDIWLGLRKPIGAVVCGAEGNGFSKCEKTCKLLHAKRFLLTPDIFLRTLGEACYTGDEVNHVYVMFHQGSKKLSSPRRCIGEDWPLHSTMSMLEWRPVLRLRLLFSALGPQSEHNIWCEMELLSQKNSGGKN